MIRNLKIIGETIRLLSLLGLLYFSCAAVGAIIFFGAWSLAACF